MSTNDNPNLEQAALRNQTYQQLLNASPVGMAICDVHGICLQRNATFQQWLAKLEPSSSAITQATPLAELLPTAGADITRDLAAFWRGDYGHTHVLRWHIGQHVCSLTASLVSAETGLTDENTSDPADTHPQLLAQCALLTAGRIDVIDTTITLTQASNPSEADVINDSRADTANFDEVTTTSSVSLHKPQEGHLANAQDGHPYDGLVRSFSSAKLEAICAALPFDILYVDRSGSYLGGKTSSHSNNVLTDDIIIKLRQQPADEVFAAASAHNLNTWQTRLFSTLQPQTFTLELQFCEHPRAYHCRVYMSLVDANSGIVLFQDISKAHQAEVTLHDTQAKLRAFYEASPDLIYRLNRQGMFLDYHAPANFVDVLASHPDVIKQQANASGLYLSQLLDPALANPVLQHLDVALQTGQMQTFEESIHIADNLHYRESRIAPLGIDEVMVFVRDITSRRQTEQQLEQSEHLFRSFFEDSPTPYLILLHTTASQPSMKAQIGQALVNQAFEDFLGYCQEDVAADSIQRFLQRITHPEDYALEQSLLGRLNNRSTSSYRLVKRYFRSSGELAWADVTNIIIYDDRGNYLRTFCILQDITDRIAAEDQLRDSREQLEIAINAANLVVWDWHVERDQFSSRGWFKHSMSSGSHMDFAGLNELRRYIHPDDLAIYDQHLSDCVSGQRFSFTSEFRLALSQLYPHSERQPANPLSTSRSPASTPLTNAWRWFSMIGSGVDYAADNKPVRISGVLQDIHTRKLTDLQLEETLAQLEQALKEKNLLLAEVHHRVKNNMQVLGSLLSLQAHNVTDDASKQVLKASQARVRAMADVHEVMYRSDRFSDLNIKAYIERVARTMQRALEAQHIHLHFNLQDVSITIQEAIPCGLVFNEMLSNAFKHAFPETSQQRANANVTIALYESYLPQLDNNTNDGKMTRYTGSFNLVADFGSNLKQIPNTHPWVYLEVKDNGIGMAEDKPSNFGTFLVETLVEQLQGVLAVSSRVQQGTTVVLMFPNQYRQRKSTSRKTS
ncbi:MAG: histidine kinase dimerization/phosphoacceptor domain -containing protein [Deinococcota bacterium]